MFPGQQKLRCNIPFQSSKTYTKIQKINKTGALYLCNTTISKINENWEQSFAFHSNVAAEEVIGYSGEAEPTQAPASFTLRNVVGPRSAVLSWEPIDPRTINGEFKGYKIQTWTAKTGQEKFREIIMKKDSTQSLVQAFKPFATNYARVLAFNGAYDGPPSNIVEIKTPEGKPGPVDMLECYPMGSSALLLAWKPPKEINGLLSGYRIYYQEVEGTKLGPLLERKPRINNAKSDKAKLAGLKPYSKYRVTIRAITRTGEGMPYYTECDTGINYISIYLS